MRRTAIGTLDIGGGNPTITVFALQAILNAKLRGHYRYYGRPTNYHSLWQFYRGVRRIWKKWLERRSRGSRSPPGGSSPSAPL
jgi:hypothetical protein